MDFLLVVVVIAGTFGLCYLIDKGFTRIFRGTVQHQSGKAVRLNRKYGAVGLVLTVVGIGAIVTGIPEHVLLIGGGAIVCLMGIALIVYYMTFGVYYDEDSFLYSSFGKRSAVYAYRDIRSQQLFTTAGGILIELYLADGRSVGLQPSMTGTYDFLDHAFAEWCRQTGRDPAECAFHDPDNSCWFPPEEGDSV